MTVQPRIALAGTHGFGRVHLENLARLGDRVRLVAVADPVAPTDGTIGPGVARYDSLDELLASESGIDVVIIATPIGTHAELAVLALEYGADVLVEKPPVASMATFESLLTCQAQTGGVVQVGFQSLGSHAIPDLASGERTGAVTNVTAVGLWSRPRSYWQRSEWAGRRELDGLPVTDGVVTNPLAHAVATALAIAGARTRADVVSVHADAYHANDIEADDTTVVRVETVRGISVTCALTLCAPSQELPAITISGENGDVRFLYTEDEIDTPDGPERFPRTDLLENLIDHRVSGAALLSPLEGTGAFMEVLESLRTAKISAIDPEHVTWHGDAGDAHPVIHGIEAVIARSVRAGATFSELGVRWARSREDEELAAIHVGDVVVAEYRNGRVAPTSVPRPYLHPIQTLSGVRVSDHHPTDHDWHLGFGVAIADVNGVNLWGGRSFRQPSGYQWRGDHGSIVSTTLNESTGGGRGTSIDQTLSWLDPDGGLLLDERRTIRAAAFDDGVFALDLHSTLVTTASTAVQLGSPGSNGRIGGGYGGLFWRFADCTGIQVNSAAGDDEGTVHGRRSPWLSWRADFADGPATLMFLPLTDATAAAPWFVRAADYPGVGSSLAWDQPMHVAPGAILELGLRVLISDGRLEGRRMSDLIDAATRAGAER